ncbi:MAG: hypothetical protein KF884_01345 [Fimbriimonadaceae bacterium]|nr:hypothetical protein [Fimbriimonadaceae bacterium]QYK58740.1 MAG: hypothetical protein KF884_01345 [Fimbriimonadaceae bacterium]
MALTSLIFLAAASGIVVADSVKEFSGRQGQDGWFYGYLDRGENQESDYDPGRFSMMSQYLESDSGARDYAPVWHASDPEVWTFIAPTTMHPNSLGTTMGRTPREVWPVRRWVSEVPGQVTLRGNLSKNLAGGEGLRGLIYVDGKLVWKADIAGNDQVGTDFSVTAKVKVGSLIDFVVDPLGHDRFDHARFVAQVFWEN